LGIKHIGKFIIAFVFLNEAVQKLQFLEQPLLKKAIKTFKNSANFP
jgi:hypothetical protein